jgi:hypothetical protein
MFDHADTQAETDTSLVWGADSSTLANVIDPTTAGIGAVSGDGGYWCGVTLPFQDGETGADNTKVHIRVMGICGVSITATAATIGVNLYPANGVNTLTVTQADGVRPLARLRQANGSAAGVYECIFDGIHGVGHAQSAS